MVDGRLPGRDTSKRLAELVAPLAGRINVVKDGTSSHSYSELSVTENWREALRLCATTCKDDDVDDVLLAILHPLQDEDAEITGRTRAVLAVLCLADEPNASDPAANEVFRQFAAQIPASEDAYFRSAEDEAAMEVASTRWASALLAELLQEFRRRRPEDRASVGRLYGEVLVRPQDQDMDSLNSLLAELVGRLSGEDEAEACAAALGVLRIFAEYEGITPEDHQLNFDSDLIGSLVSLVQRSGAVTLHAAALALQVISDVDASLTLLRFSELERNALVMRVTESSLEFPSVAALISVLGNINEMGVFGPATNALTDKNAGVRRAAASALGRLDDARAVEPLLAVLRNDSDAQVRRATVSALGELADARAVEPLLAVLQHDPDPETRRAAAWGLSTLGDLRVFELLLDMLALERLDMKRTAIFALSALGDTRAIEPLTKTLSDHDSTVRVLAMAALARFDDAEGLQLLRSELTSADRSARIRACGAIGQTATDQTEHWLLSQNLNGSAPYLDPAKKIDERRIKRAAVKLNISTADVTHTYFRVAQRYSLDWLNLE